MRISRVIMSAAALCGFAGAAHAEDGAWTLHGFGDVSVKNDYVTPRGVVVTTKGAMVHLVDGLSATSPGGVTVFATTFVALNPGYGDGNKEVFNEFDWSAGVRVPLAKRVTGSVEYMHWIFPNGFPHDQHNLEFTVSYADEPSGKISINPYAKLFLAVSSKSSTVVFGKPQGTGYIQLGATPTYKDAAFTLTAPTWISVGPKSFWVDDAKLATVTSLVPGGHRSNLGVFSTGLRASTPLTFLKGPAGISLYGFGQWYHLFNDGLVAGKIVLNSGDHKRDQFVFGAGLSLGF